MTHSGLSLGSLRVGVVQFPGSNCDADCVDVLKRHFNIEAKLIWHSTPKLPPLDLVVLPGGFSYGDYLRSGALASHSSIMQDVKKFADNGGAILGICNGFQILVESKILPGMLLHNENLKFQCKNVYLKSETSKPLKMPIAHGEGRYYADSKTIAELENSGSIAYRYCDEDGKFTLNANPNGSLNSIAGIYSANKKVLGMMPRPERAADFYLGGSDDGLIVLNDFLGRAVQ
jgi:phosphoribosylformylglycinamidine synthase subunit PurQ / glutaminase